MQLHWVAVRHQIIYPQQLRHGKQLQHCNKDYCVMTLFMTFESHLWLLKVNKVHKAPGVSHWIINICSQMYFGLARPFAWFLTWTLPSKLAAATLVPQLTHYCNLLGKWKCGVPKSSTPWPPASSHSLLQISHKEELSVGVRQESNIRNTQHLFSLIQQFKESLNPTIISVQILSDDCIALYSQWHGRMY